MRLAVIADVHANAHALRAVLAEVRARSFDQVLCLGDIVGYNAHPSACIELLDGRATVIAGNHDVDVTRQSTTRGTTVVAAVAQAWTRSALAPDELAWLEALPRRVVVEGSHVGVHGCFLNDSYINGYVSSTMLEANLTAVVTRGLPPVALCGHTHVAMVGFLSEERCVEVYQPSEVEWPADARAVLVNPGSVGQPRDGDTRASYAEIDTTRRVARIVRVPYDVEAAACAVEMAGLPSQLAARLREGW